MEVAQHVSGSHITREQSQVTPQMSVGEWVITFILMVIPVVNFILLFIWAFDSASKRRNFSIAYLIIAAIALGVSILLVITALILGASWGIFDFF